MTYRELVYFVKDLLKIQSDDATFENEHVIFSASKFRAVILKKYYESIKKDIPDSAYQTVCINVKDVEDPLVCSGYYYMKSTKTIPYTLSYGSVRIYGSSYFSGNIVLVPKERFEYTGLNKYTKNIIYATIGADRYLYLKSINPLYLDSIKVTGVFEKPDEASALDCSGGNNCSKDILDTDFPLEDALVPELITMVIQELLNGLYRGNDPHNNAKDDLSDIASFVRNAMKDRYAKTYMDNAGTDTE